MVLPCIEGVGAMSVYGDAIDSTLSGWRKADGSALTVEFQGHNTK